IRTHTQQVAGVLVEPRPGGLECPLICKDHTRQIPIEHLHHTQGSKSHFSWCFHAGETEKWKTCRDLGETFSNSGAEVFSSAYYAQQCSCYSRTLRSL
uniref:Uncharacterized protein n=1 Tax=Gorilla gorilla gorilla TaxID=9595 RepID=A0A2I2ZNZ2_GORGO